MAGLNDPTSGGIILDGREVAGPGPERSVVFQNHALLPWLSVYENVELAVRQVMKGAPKAANWNPKAGSIACPGRVRRPPTPWTTCA